MQSKDKDFGFGKKWKTTCFRL